MFQFWMNTFFVFDVSEADFLDVHDFDGLTFPSIADTSCAGAISDRSQPDPSFHDSRHELINDSDRTIVTTSSKAGSLVLRSGGSVRGAKHGASLARLNRLSSSFSGTVHDGRLDTARARVSPTREEGYLVDSRGRTNIVPDSSLHIITMRGGVSTDPSCSSAPTHGLLGLSYRYQTVASAAAAEHSRTEMNAVRAAVAAHKLISPEIASRVNLLSDENIVKDNGCKHPSSFTAQHHMLTDDTSSTPTPYLPIGYISSNPSSHNCAVQPVSSPRVDLFPSSSKPRTLSYPSVEPMITSERGLGPVQRRYLTLTLNKSELDKAHKDVQNKLYGADFKV